MRQSTLGCVEAFIVHYSHKIGNLIISNFIYELMFTY